MQRISNGFKLALLGGTSELNELTITVIGAGTNGDNLVLRNKDFITESLSLDQAICDESDVKFGGCIAGSFEIDINSRYQLTRRKIIVRVRRAASSPTYPGLHYPGEYHTDDEDYSIYPKMALYDRRFRIFTGEVYSCKLSKNRLTRHLVAYDAMFWKGSSDCTSLYNSMFTNGSTTLGALRQRVISDCGFTEDEETTLPADSFPIHKGEIDKITVQELLRQIAEFNGVFIFIDGYGNLKYASVGSNNTLEPEVYDYYMEADAEECDRMGFDSVIVPGVGYFDFPNAATDQESPYTLDLPVVTAQYLNPGQSPDDAHNFQTQFAAVCGGEIDLLSDDPITDGIDWNYALTYRPFELKTEARLWLEPGDPVQFNIRWYASEYNAATGAETINAHDEVVQSFVFSRHLTGIKAMIDELSAQGAVSIDSSHNDDTPEY